MPGYKQGDIVLAWVRDPEGRRISWPHPAIILSKTADIVAEKKIVVVAITKSFHRPLQTGHFLLPWNPVGDRRTGLTFECVAKCEWKVAINYEDIEKRLGFTPHDIWDQIVAEIIYQQQHKKHEGREPSQG